MSVKSDDSGWIEVDRDGMEVRKWMTNDEGGVSVDEVEMEVVRCTSHSQRNSSKSTFQLLLHFLLILPLANCSLFNGYDCAIVSGDLCNVIPQFVTVGQLSQRDVAFNVSIDQLTNWGIDISSVFQNEGYTTPSLDVLSVALNAGFNTISLDAYWSDTNNQWQICPLPFPQGISTNGIIYSLSNDNEAATCQDNVTLDSIYNVISEYIDRTQTSFVAVNMLTLKINLHVLNHTIDVQNNIRGDSILATNASNILGPSIYTPTNLQNDRSNGMITGNGSAITNTSQQFPSLKYFLNSRKRIIITADESDFLNNHTNTNTTTASPSYSQNINGNSNVIFLQTNITSINQQLLPLSNDLLNNCTSDSASYNIFLESVNQTSQIPFRNVFDTSNMPFTNSTISNISHCGYSPIISAANETTALTLIDFIQSSFWSWAPNEPNTNKSSSPAKSPGNPVALQCATLSAAGWQVSNCYDSFPVLCRLNNSNFDWVVSPINSTYFDAPQACPPGTEFSVPRTSLESRAAQLALRELPDTSPPQSNSGSLRDNFDPGPSAWIDFNSIAVADCWVTGGPFAVCPYHQIPTTNRNGVSLLIVAAVVSFVLFSLMILLNFRRIPLRRNQARWRRVINKFSEQEYEGVPL